MSEGTGEGEEEKLHSRNRWSKQDIQLRDRVLAKHTWGLGFDFLSHKGKEQDS